MNLTSKYELLQSLPKGGKTVEIGVLRGDFSVKMMEILESAHHYMVDPWAWTDVDHGQVWAWDAPGDHPTGEDIYLGVQRRFWGRSDCTILRTVSVRAAALFENDSLDVVYIDGNHRQEQCLMDLRAWFPKIRPGGTIAGHDYNEVGVQHAVAAFIREIASGGPLSYVVNATEEAFGSFWWTK
jgi:hypothetical protein